jgi:hypothetical protein
MKCLLLTTTILCCLLLNAIFFTAASQKVTEEHFEKEEWNGYITFVHRSISKRSGAYSEYIHKSHNLFSELRMEATITKGKGVATTTFSKRDLSRKTEQIAGKTYETEETDGGASHGSAPTELSIVYLEESNSYSITVPTPATTGTATRIYNCKGCAKNPEPNTYSIGQEESLIMVEEQKLGTNPNILAGEIVDRDENANGEITETITRWSFVRGPVDVELIVLPQAYASWIPAPGKDEATAGEKMQVVLQLQGKGGKEPRLKAKAFELRLINTSREPGIAINYPIAPTGTAAPDLQFLKQGGAEKESEGQIIRVPSVDGKTGMATIGSFDGGGYAILEVEAILEGGLRVKGHLEVPTGPTAIEIPKRKKGTKIAQAWLDKNGSPGEMEDNETTIGNNNNGDGLTAYEEYRGVFSEGKHMRLDPKKKELGVQIDKDHIAALAGGVHLFAKASGLTVIKLWKEELEEDRMLNKNSSSGKAGSQYALRLIKESLPKGVVGVNEPVKKTNKTPQLSIKTVIDIDQLKQLYHAQAKVFQDSGVVMPYSMEEEINNTIAHELSHGVNVMHHGKSSDEIGRTAYAKGRVLYRVYTSSGLLKEIDPEKGFEVKGTVGEPGCEASGDLSCIMAYTSVYQWSFVKAADGALEYRAVPLLPQGSRLCTSPDGTGLNATGFFGNATWGNCLSQIKVKDY